VSDARGYASIRIWEKSIEDLDAITRWLYEHKITKTTNRVEVLEYVLKKFRESVDKSS
jgi:hypothetical protein